VKIPRLLPLIAVAIGGVVAVNVMAGAQSLPEMLSAARAFAEDVAAPAKGAKPAAKVGDKSAAKDPAKPEGPVSPVPSTRILDGDAPPKPQTMACAALGGDLAKEAGLSPAELKVLQDLGARRGQIESLEKNVDVQQQLLLAAEAKVDAKITTMRGLIAEMKGLLGQADEKQKAENARLVKVYEGMKPKDAAAQLAIMKDDVRLDIVQGMKERNLSAILGAMPPVAAKDLTEKLALRYATSAPVKAAQAAIAPPTQTAAAPPAKGPAPKAPASKAAPRAAAPRPKAAPAQASAAPAAPPPIVPPPAAEPAAKTG